MNEPFAEGCSRYFVVGASNTGKTTLCIKIIKRLFSDENDPFSQLIIISPNYNMDGKLKSLAQRAVKQGIGVRVYDNFTKNTVNKFVDYMSACAAKGARSLVYIDDPVGLGTFTSNVNQRSAFNSFVTGVKHYNSTIVFSTQSVGAMSRSARKNIDVFIFLPDMTSRQECYTACKFVSSYEDFAKLMDAYAVEPYCALWVNVQYGRKGVFRINAAGSISPITTIPV